MKHKYLLIVTLGLAALIPSISEAAKTTYIYTDRRFHFVKRVEADKDVLKEKQLNHPYTFNELQLREALSRVRFSKQMVLKKEIEEQEVFNPRALDFLVPHLTQAFKDAKPNEEVVFAFVTHKSKFLVKDERLTIVQSWIEGDRLHLDFRKLMAKISANYDKLGDVTQAMNRAQGLRVSLEADSGQEFGKSTDELILVIPNAAAAVATQEKRMEEEKTKEARNKETVKRETVRQTPAPTAIEERLQQLEQLKKKGLLSKDEYQQKKKEILEQL